MKGLFIAVPFILVLVFLKGGYSEDPPQQIPGGVSPDNKPASPEVKKIIREINTEIKTHLEGAPGGLHILGKIKPISYKSQIVNGINYFVKVRARTPNKNVFYHLRIYKGFDDKPAQLLKVEGPKRKKDVITFF